MSRAPLDGISRGFFLRSQDGEAGVTPERRVYFRGRSSVNNYNLWHGF